MKLLQLAAAFLLLSAVQAAADEDWVNNDSFGVHAKSCKTWADDRRGKAVVWDADVEWMFGFLTALVRAKGPLDGGAMSPEDLPTEIDEICTAHPQWDLPEALEYLAIRHRLISPSSAVVQ
jgi:hypothetical protein